jgi:hypothetical protein
LERTRLRRLSLSRLQTTVDQFGAYVAQALHGTTPTLLAARRRA